MDDHTNDYETRAIKEDNPLIQDRTIAALFADADQAGHARDALKTAGYDHVDLTSADAANTDSAKPVHEHSFWQGVKDFFSGDDDAHLYGEGVRRGNTLVTVHAEQGRAAAAVDILDGFNPLDIDGSEQAWKGEGWSRDDARSSYLASSQRDKAQLSGALDADATIGDTDELRTDDGQAIPLVDESPIGGRRDPDAGNVRVRSYVRDVPAYPDTVDFDDDPVLDPAVTGVTPKP